MSEESKFNFSEEEEKAEALKKEQSVEQSKENVKKDAQGLFTSISKFLSELLDFRDDTDRDATIQAIKGDIPFKGATAWILICSIFVASIGLNANSTAVVIGAMLISPLMGPILGIGLSIAINDIDTLKKSLINLVTMIVLSLMTAFLFFKFFPTADIMTTELFGRTKPDLRDVLIAFFGGAALIIARTKKGTIASVIFGVAIATALMPPLCTAGYGLAHNWDYFIGAMYLFTINTIFIALATFLVLKILRFPMLRYANSKKRKRIAQLASLIAVLVMAPAIWTFVNFITQSGLEGDYNNFMETEVKSNHELWLQKGIPNWEEKTITLYFNGEVPDATIADLENEIKTYEKIKDYSLVIQGNKNRSIDKISDAYDRAIRDLDQKDIIITGLQNQIEGLQVNITNLNKQLESKTISNTIPFSSLSRDAKVRFKDLEYFGYSNMLESKDFINIDTVSVVRLKWNTNLPDSIQVKKEEELKTWISTQLNKSNILILK
ncbi:DUF389 domain-containing protein [Algibacter amylolyticus]|uniref:DUF389 domain-containing protein n=1 Tax=Algibacter amylolyticus TaxID=1608400 RepID=A0A5M7BL68_9FLAO|nr:DUF389 domain-containing protein [Algibacter amylolyticus]KAA5828094.1 DUF389 domain-containing protein [Algibacter amylolyticus]MBB5267342.1 putative hydrophobic protein (TIGR00271 family) [Algibacter amylolyticus]TSJ82339.1 DUF389 domain-containing protein [Algibacter amylolyticus]